MRFFSSARHIFTGLLLYSVSERVSNSSDKTNPVDSLISEHNTWEKRTVSRTKRMGQKDLLLGFRVDFWPWGRDDRESTVGHFSRFKFHCNSLKAWRQLIRAIDEASGGCISYRADSVSMTSALPQCFSLQNKTKYHCSVESLRRHVRREVTVLNHQNPVLRIQLDMVHQVRAKSYMSFSVV